MDELESVSQSQEDACEVSVDNGEVNEASETQNIENGSEVNVEPPDIDYIESTSREALLEQNSITLQELSDTDESTDVTSSELTIEEKEKMKEESGYSDEIIENIDNMSQYEILSNADLKESEINGKKCLIKENINLDYADEDGISNRDRMSRGLAPLDEQTGKPIELHHLGQKVDSPLVELTEEEHRTGEYEDGKKNQSLWHDNNVNSEVHGEGNTWDYERKTHWKSRI